MKKAKVFIISGVILILGFIAVKAAIFEDTDTKVFVNAAYNYLLHRDVDPGGLTHWSGLIDSRGLNRQDFLFAIYRSSEYQEKNQVEAKQNSEFIVFLYQDLLGRQPNQQEIDFVIPQWLNQLAAGQLNRNDVAKGFIFSEEFKALFSAELVEPPVIEETGTCDLSVFRNRVIDASEALQNCINNTDGGAVELLPGQYFIAQTVYLGKPIILRTQGKTPEMPKCGYEDGHTCAELIALPALSSYNGILAVSSGGVVIDHIVVNGNKAGRGGSNAASECAAGNNRFGFNINVQSNSFTLQNSVSKNALCGTGLTISAGSNHRVVNNVIAFNGVHSQLRMWSDGATIIDVAESVFLNNEFIDNTDVDLIFGGCVNCKIQNNVIRHSESFEGSTFSGLMIHAWPTTSGNYTGTDVSNNVIDCSAKKRCGFGLYIGSDAWYDTDVYGGWIHDNSITNAQLGLNIDDVHNMSVYNNQSVGSGGGYFVAGCNFQPAIKTVPGNYNIGRDSFGIDLRNPSIDAYTHDDWDGCILNWWTSDWAPKDVSSTEASISTADYVNAAYNYLLHRDVDPGGLTHWSGLIDSRGLNRQDFLFAIYRSSEYQEKNQVEAKQNSEFIAFLYQDLLGRQPNQQEIDFVIPQWLNQLAAGQLNRNDVAKGFIFSEEFGKKIRDFILKTASGFLSVGVDAFMRGAYGYLLHREADPGGLAFWKDLIDKGLYQKDFIFSLYRSHEYQDNNDVDDLNDEEFVDFLYKDLLGRNFKIGEADFWINRLKSGAFRNDVARGFIESEEFFDKFLATLKISI